MNSVRESLQDPVWQIGVSVLVLVIMMAVLVLRSADLRLRVVAQKGMIW